MATHFATVILIEDDGRKTMYSKSGAIGPYEVQDQATLQDPTSCRYGSVKGRESGETGFYRDR